MKKIVIIDGQGGRMGKGILEQLRQKQVKAEIGAVGTNSIATATMLKAGADWGSTGENPVLVACRNADIIAGPIGIVVADSLFGEVTPSMAIAVGQSSAQKVLLPANLCGNYVVGTGQLTLTQAVQLAAEHILQLCEN